MQQNICKWDLTACGENETQFFLLTTVLKRVLMIPGATQLTLMLLCASSGANIRVRPTTAVLLTL